MGDRADALDVPADAPDPGGGAREYRGLGPRALGRSATDSVMLSQGPNDRPVLRDAARHGERRLRAGRAGAHVLAERSAAIPDRRRLLALPSRCYAPAMWALRALLLRAPPELTSGNVLLVEAACASERRRRDGVVGRSRAARRRSNDYLRPVRPARVALLCDDLLPGPFEAGIRSGFNLDKERVLARPLQPRDVELGQGGGAGTISRSRRGPCSPSCRPCWLQIRSAGRASGCTSRQATRR